MNRAFTHAEGDLDVTVAYYAASQMLVFTAEQFGFRKITRALELWGQGKRTPTSSARPSASRPQEYDARYRAWEMARLARYEGQYMFDVEGRVRRRREGGRDGQARRARTRTSRSPSRSFARTRPTTRRREIDAALDRAARQGRALRRREARGDEQRPRRRGEATCAPSRPPEATGTRSRWGSPRWRRPATTRRRSARRSRPRIASTRRRSSRCRASIELASADKRDATRSTALRAVARLDQHDRRAYGLLLEQARRPKRWDEARGGRRVGDLRRRVERGRCTSNYARALAATATTSTAAFELESALLCDSKPHAKADGARAPGPRAPRPGRRGGGAHAPRRGAEARS